MSFRPDEAEALKVAMRESVGDLMMLHADTLFSCITGRQMDTLLTAYRHGYYSLPRKAGIKAIAKEKHIPKTTYHEHLKKAENRLVAGLMPYMQLYARPASSRAGPPRCPRKLLTP